MRKMFRRVIMFMGCVVLLCVGCEKDNGMSAGDSAATKAMINVGAVDAVVASASAESQSSMDALVQYISANTANAPERAYGIYRWIRNNVQADFQTAALDDIDPATQTAETVFATRLAVCTGYANLFETLVRKAGFDAAVIYGYGVMYYADPAVPLHNYLHIWNGIKIDEKWYLVELSWIPSASLDGSSDPNFFFLTNPSDFVYRHLPTYTKWQLLDNPVTEEEFWARLRQ